MSSAPEADAIGMVYGCMCSPSTKAAVARRQLPGATPRIVGEARGLWKRACITAPATAKEAPEQMRTMTLGMRSSRSGFHNVEVPAKRFNASLYTTSQGVSPYHSVSAIMLQIITARIDRIMILTAVIFVRDHSMPVRCGDQRIPERFRLQQIYGYSSRPEDFGTRDHLRLFLLHCVSVVSILLYIQGLALQYLLG